MEAISAGSAEMAVEFCRNYEMLNDGRHLGWVGRHGSGILSKLCNAKFYWILLVHLGWVGRDGAG